jgi:hypothetical protein
MAEPITGTFEDLIGITPEPLRELVRAVRDVIVDVYPASCEVVRLGDRAATYGVGPKKMTEGFVYIMPQKGWINLGFYRGTDLADPDQLLEGTGAKLRHIKMRSLDDVHRPSVRALIQAAVDERTSNTRKR